MIALAGRAATLDPASYVGSERCKDCHAEQYDGWKQTYHATVVQDARANPSVVKGDFKAPDLGFTLQEVEYTIGGHREQRYMKKIGEDYYVLPKIWSVQSHAWRSQSVWSWKKMPYGRFCKGCHVTAYSPEKNQAVEDQVGCEACHGPGRDHALSAGREPIVNPSRLPEDRREMICAACHVRGTDPTGIYSFPVGFAPGDDLGPHYVPTGKTEDESNSQAILRSFVEWKKRRERGVPSKCEVCGIPGAVETKKAGGEDASSLCYGCHELKGKYQEHTRHPPSARLACLDCHVQQTKDLMNRQSSDIHSYGYFLVHAERCYDPAIEKTCSKCHKDKGIEWARETVETWRRPLPLDH